MIIATLYLTSGRAPLQLFFQNFFWQFLCIFSSRWTLESTCQVPLKIPLGFWLEVHWIYRLIWGELASLHNLPIQEHGMPLHFFRCSFMSFSKVLKCFLFFFFSCRSNTFLVRFILEYFIVFVVTVNYIFHFTLYFSIGYC